MTDQADASHARSPSLRGLPVDAALDPLIAMGRDGRVLEWNRNAERTFGWSRQEALGQDLASLIIPADLRPKHREGLARYLATGEGTILNTRVEVRALDRSGREFPIELAISPVSIENETIFVAFLRDISEHKRHEEWLRRRAREAEFLYRATALAAESESFEDALRGCIEIVCQVTGWPIGHALAPAPDGGEDAFVTTGIWYAGNPDMAARMRAATGDTRFIGGYGLPGLVWRSGEPVWVAPDFDDSNFPRAVCARQLGLHSGFGFPIKIRGEAVAVLEFFTTEERAPDESLTYLARTIGAQIGRLIERRIAEQHRQVLVRELTHRVKNTLAVVSAIANQTLRASKSREEFTHSFQARLQALARAHSLLTEAQWDHADIEAILQAELALHQGTEQCFELRGAPVSLRPKSALALTLVFHEMATNAAKYGALSVPGGKVTVEWRRLPRNRLQVDWRESGGPAIDAPPAAEGFGSVLIRLSVERDLGGEIAMHYHPGGLHCCLLVPLDPPAAGLGLATRPAPV